MQPVRNKIAQLEEDGLFGLKLEVVEGFVFLHLDLDVVTPDLVRKLRRELDKLLDVLQTKGHDTLFLVSPYKRSVRFWQLIKPCFEVMELEDGNWLGSWLTFKED